MNLLKPLRALILAGMFFSFTLSSFAQSSFTELLTPAFVRVSNSAVSWGDFDNDGDLDVLICGLTTAANKITRLYRNDGPGSGNGWNFSLVSISPAALPGVFDGDLAWGDVDGDSDLDFVLTGNSGTEAAPSPLTRVYYNEGASGTAGWRFITDGSPGLPQVYHSSVSWADYDNDGDLDLLLQGQTTSGVVTRIYENLTGAGGFAWANNRFSGYEDSRTFRGAWTDYDRDGDLDVLMSRDTTTCTFIFVHPCQNVMVWRNHFGLTTPFETVYEGTFNGVGYWMDYEGDSYPDIIAPATLFNNIQTTAALVKNRSGNFGIAGATGVVSLVNGAFATGDLGDGCPDCLITGAVSSGNNNVPFSKIYSNDGNGGFSEISANLTGLWKGDAAFGDIDGDDDLDVLITGLDINGQRQTKIYRNDLGNTPPQPPGLHPRPGIPIVRPNSVRFSWLPGSDSETPQNGLAYALRVGTYPGGANILAPPSLANGRRKMAGLEQTIRDTTWTLSLPPGRILKPGIYYWSVQTIDEAFAGSAFSAERTFVINPNLRYTDDALTLAPHHRGDFDLGDYDNDGDLDLLLTGELSFPMAPHTGLYRNDGFNAGAGWSFNEVSTGMPGVAYGGIAWGDYDADGDLDVVLTGSTATRFTPLTKIYRNDAGAFTDINAPLTPLVLGDAAWGDFDNDGDLDLIITGTDSTGSEANAATKLYRNDGHDRFAEMPAGSSPNPGFTIPGVSRSSLAWSDYDADGDLDLLLTGRRRNGGLVQDITRLYRNDGTAFASGQNYWKFIDINAGLPGFNVDQFDQRASVSWGDYDADGDPDLLLFGKLDPGDFSLKPKVFRNDGPSGNNWRFTEIQTPDLLEYFSVRPQAWSAAWGDYDHDGDLDALLSRWDVILTAPGFETVFGASEIYENINGDFYDRVWLETTHQEQPTGIGGSAIFADFDGNHRLDVLAMGYLDGGISTPFTYRIFRDTGPGNNNPPAAPSGLSQTISGDTITFHWNATNDDHTSRNGLTYNLHIQRSNAGPGVMPSMSDPSTGYRRVVRSGNAGSRTSWSIQNPPPGNYTWGVQAIDHEFIGSPFTMGNFIQPLGRNRTLLPGFWYSDAEWADYDNDGDLDVALMGQHQSAAPANMTKVLRNDGADNFGNPIFTDINAPLIGARLGSIAWGDYDNDHYPDLLLTGTIESQPLRLSKLYHNNQGSSFTEVALGLPGVKFGGGEWGDYDLDGDLDFILFGDTEGQRGYTQLFRNDGAGGPAGWRFTPDTLQTQSLLVEGGPVRLSSGAVAWGDCDNDGDLDLLMVGTHAGSQQISTVFLNEGLFANLHSNLEPLAGIFVNAAWGDYDNDGDLDILLKGMSNNVGVGPISKIYRNDGNVFSAAAILEYRYQGGAAWGDYDNDGDLDVVTNGRTLHLTPPLYPLIYRNDQQAFVRDTVAAAILRDNDRWNGTGFGDVAWADYDNDHDLDLLAAGWFEVAFNRTAPATFIYENGHAPGQANTPPTTPTNLRAIASEATIMTLIWNAATDQQTPAAGLTYNLRVGTTPGGAEIISPHSRPDGYRQLAQLGNTNHATQRPLLRLTPGRTYYWSVQAVDHNFAGSPFAPEQQFVAGVSTSVHEPANALPKAYSLSQNWPNPFNPVTSVQYAVISEQFVSLKVYDVMGKEVATLLNAKQPAGYYRVTFDGRGLASGVYLLHLRAGSFVATRKMLLTK